MTKSYLSGQKAQMSPRDPRLTHGPGQILIDPRVEVSSRDLQRLRQNVSTNIHCAHVLGSNLVSWASYKKDGKSALQQEYVYRSYRRRYYRDECYE